MSASFWYDVFSWAVMKSFMGLDLALSRFVECCQIISKCLILKANSGILLLYGLVEHSASAEIS